MNKHEMVKVHGQLKPWARTVIQSLDGLSASSAPDGYLELDGQVVPIEVKASRRVDAAAARLLVDTQRGSQIELLVVAGSTTEAARTALESAGIGYVDEMGRAFLRYPGIYVRLGPSASAGATKADRESRAIRLAGRASIVAQAILLEPDCDWTITSLARRSEASAGLAHRVVRRLEDQDLMESTGSGPSKRRRLAKPSALLDLLAEEDHEPKLSRIGGYALDATRGRHSGLSQRLQQAGIRHALTGVFAASLTAPVLTTVPIAEVRISSSALVGDVLEALQAKRVDDGPNVVLMQGDGDEELHLSRRLDDTWLAAPTRIYLDALRDPRRGREAAEAYRAEALGY